MNNTNDTLGKRIANLRKQKGLTQEDLGNKLNISSQAVSKWENDISAPDISLLKDLANILDVSIDELLDNKKEVSSIIYEPEVQKKDYNSLMIKLRVISQEGDKVNINCPIKLIEILAQGSLEIGDSKIFKQINWNDIIAMVEKGLLGKLLEVESSDGDIVEIFVE